LRGALLGGERGAREYKPVICHLSGHGKFSEGILFADEGEEENIKTVRAEDLAYIVGRLKDNLRLVFLNVCHTQLHAEALVEVVDYVIAMKGDMDDKSARVFASSFYKLLGYGRPAKESFELAKKQIELKELKDSDAPMLLIGKGVDASRLFFDQGADHLHITAEIKSDAGLQELGNQFVAQLRIAGHFQDAEQSQQAIYLDHNLYVHRVKTETALIRQAEQFADSAMPQGKWVSIIGDAGHGKSSLLWYLFDNLKSDERFRVVPFLAQLEGNWSKIEETVLKLSQSLNDAHKLVVIIDTLDIMVGMNDPSLAAMLNSLRSAGCLLITSSRRQEAERLFRLTPSDAQVELKRYTDLEARQAIRNYIDLAFPKSGISERERQFDKIWGLVEQQRDARELDMEPLILRMLFEAYVPEPIPPDINTQQVYKKFWDERVLLDRVVKDANERFARKRLCLLIARQIAFGGERSGKLSVDLLCNVWETERPSQFPYSTLEGLVSTGVLQWTEGASAVQFFHQTFFEYTAAYDLISSEDSIVEARVQTLLSDVAAFDFFHAPILKQFAIQSFETDYDRWQRVMQGLYEINNELAAQMTLEVVGKIPNDEYLVGLCKKWIDENGEKLQNVICETVRHFPRIKTATALDLLAPYLGSKRAKAIYSLCTDTFSKDEPGQVYEFLRHRLPQIKAANDDEKYRYREALCAVIQFGAPDALDVLLELFPHLKPGQQAGALSRIGEIVTKTNAARLADFLKKVTDLIPHVKKESRSEIWDSFLFAAEGLHRASPKAGKSFAQWLFNAGCWKKDQITALYTGMVIGPSLSDPIVMAQSLSALASDDHYTRLLNTGILSNLPDKFSSNVMDSVLSVEKSIYREESKFGSLFAVVSHLKRVEPGKILRFLGEWPWLDTGVGTPLRSIMEYLAVADPAATKKWLFEKLASIQGPINDKLFSAFTILANVNIHVFETTEIQHLYDTALASSKAIKERFAGMVGSIAIIEQELAAKIFSRMLAKEDKDCQLAAINSLAYCLKARPEFALDQGRAVLQKALATRIGLLHAYLIAFKNLPQQYGVSLLQRFDDLFTETILIRLSDDKTFGELLTVLKIFARANPRLAFELSKRIPIVHKSVAGGIASLYDQVSEHTSDRELLFDVLEGIPAVSKFNQIRMKNALSRMLPRLNQKLSGRYVVEMVLRVYKQITDEQALLTFIDAALRIPSWTEEDTKTLLQDRDLPSSVLSLLSRKLKG
ncbi:MAG TPA: hypothetical protein VLR90_08110, partial [Blastocatellia bacterium]|nr:hypothetical protein [Blastocatellia bacterium]